MHGLSIAILVLALNYHLVQFLDQRVKTVDWHYGIDSSILMIVSKFFQFDTHYLFSILQSRTRTVNLST